MDLFSTNIRRTFTVEEYWELYEIYASGSLQFHQDPNSETVNHRLSELSAAEDKLGFVFDAEKLWLTDLSTSRFVGSYADWLLAMLNEHVLTAPLIWGVYSFNYDYDDVEFHNVWSADLKQITYPIETLPKLPDELNFELNVYGERHHPNPTHLVYAFKSLFNLHYHLLENQEHIRLSLPKIYRYSVCSIFENNTAQWLLTYQTEYGGGDELLLVDRTATKPTNETQLAIRNAYLAEQFHNWKPLDRGENSAVPDRIVHEHKALLGVDLVTKYLQHRASYSYLKDPNKTCTCGEPSNFYLRFHWGSVDGFIEYTAGDDIRWHGRTFGYKELPKVYVRASSDTSCAECGHSISDTFIEIAGNRIVGLKPEIATSVKYKFQDPFISDELIAWDDYQKQWIDNSWNQLLSETNVTEIKHCTHVRWPPFSESASNEFIEYLYLLSKHRALVSQELFARSFYHFFKYRMQTITQDTHIESCAMLHSHYQDEPCLIKFYWGSIQDFPEYKLGESIQWSDFSVGDKNMDDIVYARGFIDGAHHIPVLIHIKDDKIVAVHFHADYSVEKKDHYGYYRENTKLFYTDQWLPWLNMPGRNYIRSFRIKRPDKSELVPAKELCCASGYQPSDAYLELLG